jgi:hypothetical protein
MVIETTSGVITFFDEGQKTEQGPNQGSLSGAVKEGDINRELARLDLEAQSLINRILDMAEDREKNRR